MNLLGCGDGCQHACTVDCLHRYLPSPFLAGACCSGSSVATASSLTIAASFGGCYVFVVLATRYDNVSRVSYSREGAFYTNFDTTAP